VREQPRGEKAHSNATLNDSDAFVWGVIAFVTNDARLDSGSRYAYPE
jgi:hypothetical protein